MRRALRLTWGLGPEELQKINPALVVLRVTGLGRKGPYSSRRAFGTLAEAISGLAHQTGGDRAPTLPPFGLADGVAAWAGAYAVMLALYHRDVTKGGGQVIDLSLLEPLVGVPSARRAKKSGACEISLPASSRQDSQNGCEAMPTTVGRNPAPSRDRVPSTTRSRRARRSWPTTTAPLRCRCPLCEVNRRIGLHDSNGVAHACDSDTRCSRPSSVT